MDPSSSTVWYMATNFNQVDTVEIAYLAGERGAFIDQSQNFETDVIGIKCRLDFAAAALDWIGLAKNPGA